MSPLHRPRPSLLAMFALPFAFAVGASFGGCARVHKDEPVERAPSACCTQADAQLQHFKGCSVGRANCRRDERWWMRGNVTCTPVDEAQCEGGRCCEYRPQYDADAAAGADGGAPSSEADPPAVDTATETAPADETPPAEDAVPSDAASPPEASGPDAASPPEADGDDPEAPLP